MRDKVFRDDQWELGYTGSVATINRFFDDPGGEARLDARHASLRWIGSRCAGPENFLRMGPKIVVGRHAKPLTA